MIEEGHTDISAEKDVMKKYTPVLSARSADHQPLSKWALSIRFVPLGYSTKAIEAANLLWIQTGVTWLWFTHPVVHSCGMAGKTSRKKQRIGVLEGSPVHTSKKVHTVDQGSGVNGEATPLWQLLAPNTFPWRGFAVSCGMLYLKWLNLCLFKENLLWSHA